MSYQFLPNIIFILAVAGIILIILRHLPKTSGENRPGSEQSIDEKFEAKGVDLPSVSKIKSSLELWWKKFFNFILEAKDLKPSEKAGYRIKQIFRKRAAKIRVQDKLPDLQIKEQEIVSVKKDEAHYLATIKQDPKNLESYDELGKFYLSQKNHNEGRDIYLYLTRQEPGNSVYHARLAMCFYSLGGYEQAIKHYETSLSLDSTQPNRYYNLGLCLESAEKLEEAAIAYGKAESLEPENPKYSKARSALLSKLGKTQKPLDILDDREKPNKPKKKSKIV